MIIFRYTQRFVRSYLARGVKLTQHRYFQHFVRSSTFIISTLAVFLLVGCCFVAGQIGNYLFGTDNSNILVYVLLAGVQGSMLFWLVFVRDREEEPTKPKIKPEASSEFVVTGVKPLGGNRYEVTTTSPRYGTRVTNVTEI